jgi:hypothetical protein
MQPVAMLVVHPVCMVLIDLFSRTESVADCLRAERVARRLTKDLARKELANLNARCRADAWIRKNTSLTVETAIRP